MPVGVTSKKAVVTDSTHGAGRPGPKCRKNSDSNIGAFDLFIGHPVRYKRSLSLFPASGVFPTKVGTPEPSGGGSKTRMTELNSKRNVAVGFQLLWLLVIAAAWLNAAAEVKASDPRPGEAPVAGTDRVPASAASIRTSLASVAASAFEPAGNGGVELASFAAKPAVAVLNVPAPGSLSPAPAAEDHIPEPGAIGFGLAVAALILGNFAKALMRCWKITSATPNREP